MRGAGNGEGEMLMTGTLLFFSLCVLAPALRR
jgi:hypothetical protein